MKKRSSRQKDLHNHKQKKCRICLIKTAGQPLLRSPGKYLLSKYCTPQVQTFDSRKVNDILFGPYSKQAIDYVESTKLAKIQEGLSNYYSFQDTVRLIRQVVHMRVEKDFYGWVDFQKQHFSITNAYYIRRKHLAQNTKKIQSNFKSIASLQSTEQASNKHAKNQFQKKIKKQLDNLRPVKVSTNQTNSSTIQIQRLTKNLDFMLQKIGQISICRPGAKGSYRAISRIQNRRQAKMANQFINNIKGSQISVINSNRQAVQLQLEFRQLEFFTQNYGLEVHKLQKQKKKVKNSLKQSQKGICPQQKAPPQTPKPRFYHASNEYEQVEEEKKSAFQANKYSRNKRMQPASPGAHRLSSSNSHSKKISLK